MEVSECDEVELLRAELEATKQRMALIAAVSNAVSMRAPLDEQLAEIVYLTRSVMGCDVCVIRRVEGDNLVLTASTSRPAEGPGRRSLPADTAIGRVLLETRRPLSITDARLHELTREFMARPSYEHFVSYAGAPMVIDDRVIGIVGVYNRTSTRSFDECQLEQLQILAYHAAVAIENDTLCQRALEEHDRRLRAELAACHIEQIYREAIIASGGVLYRRRFDEDTYDFLGPGITLLTGYRPEQLTQKVFAKAVREQQLVGQESYLPREERVRSAHSGLLRRWRADYLFEKADGSHTWISDASVPWIDEAGNVVGSLGILLDINERKGTEEVLRERESRLQAILNAEPDCVKLLSLDGVILEVNAAGLALLDAHNPSQLFGHSMFDFVVEEEREEYKAAHQAACRGEGGVLRYHVVALSGQRRLVESRSAPMRNAKGQISAVLKVTRDITEQQEMELILRQSQKMDAIGHLAGGVAHDFNNILTGIMGLVELLIPSSGPAEQVDLKEMRRLCERGADLTRQLLAFSRRSMLRPVVLNLNHVIEETQKLLRRLIGEHIELVTSFDPHVGPVKADAGQIEQVLLNLALNARDAMRDGGRLTIRTSDVEKVEDSQRRPLSSSAQRHVLLLVSDSGEGITPEVRERIFEPFFTTKEAGRGTGLGLTTVYGIVKQCGGDIFVSSQVGQGTTFEIFLPCVAEPANPAKTAEETRPMGHGTETVLVAEDEDPVRSLVARVLRMFGYQVIEARNGKEALEKAQSFEGEIHLLITDVIMPQMGGTELARHIRQGRPRLKVLFISGYTSDDFSLDTETDVGFVGFIQKPFTPAVMLSSVRELLDRV